jgi:hypothetical protein
MVLLLVLQLQLVQDLHNFIVDLALDLILAEQELVQLEWQVVEQGLHLQQMLPTLVSTIS